MIDQAFWHPDPARQHPQEGPRGHALYVLAVSRLSQAGDPDRAPLPPGGPVRSSRHPSPGPGTACEDSWRIELALALRVKAREICVSPGMVTSFLFDTPLEDVELQDEVRFLEVPRGQRGISFVPPRAGAWGAPAADGWPRDRGRPGARHLLAGGPAGQATRQVEVYLDLRPRESYQQEIDKERAKKQRLANKQELRADSSGREDCRASSPSLGFLGAQR